MTAITTWVLVADGSRARVLARAGASGSFVQPAGGMFSHAVHRAADLGTERPGRVRESANASHHAIEPRADRRREGKHGFARMLAQMLEQRALERAYDRLILVAPPRTLGDLRDGLGKEARFRLVGTLDRDLTALATDEIERHLAAAKLL